MLKSNLNAMPAAQMKYEIAKAHHVNDNTLY